MPARARSRPWFEISGYFATDLTVGASKPGEQSVYFKADSGKTVTSNIRVINDGPDLIPEATIRIQMGGTGFCVKPKPDGSCDAGNTQSGACEGDLAGGGGGGGRRSRQLRHRDAGGANSAQTHVRRLDSDDLDRRLGLQLPLARRDGSCNPVWKQQTRSEAREEEPDVEQ